MAVEISRCFSDRDDRGDLACGSVLVAKSEQDFPPIGASTPHARGGG
jgi:hypothetical protein